MHESWQRLARFAYALEPCPWQDPCCLTSIPPGRGGVWKLLKHGRSVLDAN